MNTMKNAAAALVEKLSAEKADSAVVMAVVEASSRPDPLAWLAQMGIACDDLSRDPVFSIVEQRGFAAKARAHAIAIDRLAKVAP